MLKMKKEIDYSLAYSGPCYVPAEFKLPGFQHCLVSNKPGEIEQYQRWGYEVVKNEIPASEKKPSQSHALGAAYTIQSKCGQTLVLMAISDELYEKLQAHRKSLVSSTEQALGRIDNVPDSNHFGKNTIDKKRL